MCVCMCMCMYMYMYIYIHIHAYFYIFLYFYISIFTFIIYTSKPKPWFDTSETEYEAEALWSQPYRRGTASPTQGEEGEDASDAKETQVWGVSGVSPKMPWKWRRYCGWLRNLTPVGNYERYLWNTVNNGIRMGKNHLPTGAGLLSSNYHLGNIWKHWKRHLFGGC